MKYELGKKHETLNLHQVVALKDFGDVKRGDIGGWIEKEENLSQEGLCWVSGDAQVYGDAWVFGDAEVYGDAWVFGNAWVSGDARVSGNAWVFGDARVYGDAEVYGDAWVFGNAWVFGDAWDKSPLQIRGTRHFLTTSSHTKITIGCVTHTTDFWLKNYQEIGKKEGYSEEEIEEYRLLITTAVRWLNDR